MKLNHINMKNLGLTEKLIQESKLYKDLFIVECQRNIKMYIYAEMY
jgi:hypothetical protein